MFMSPDDGDDVPLVPCANVVIMLLLPPAMKVMDGTTALNSLKSTANSADTSNDVKPQVDRINGLFGDAVSSRVPKETLDNSTICSS